MKVCTAPSLKGAIFSSLVLSLSFFSMLLPNVAQAKWVVVDDMTQATPRDKMFDNNACQFRLRYKDGQHAGSGTFQDHFFTVSKVHQFRRDNLDGAVYSQSFRAPIQSSDLGALRFGGALGASYYNTIQGLYSSPKNPWNLAITLTRNSTLHQLSLSYTFYNESARSNYNSTVRLEAGNFRLEAQCEESTGGNSEPEKIEGISVDASSSYSSSYNEAKMLDGVTSTYWIGAPNQNGYSLTIDLGEQQDLHKVLLNWFSSYYISSDFDVEVSSDGSSYSLVQSGLNGTSDINLSGHSGRYIQITMHSVTSSFPVIRELEVWKE